VGFSGFSSPEVGGFFFNSSASILIAASFSSLVLVSYLSCSTKQLALSNYVAILSVPH